MKILCNVEIEICIECGFPCKLAFSVLAITAVVPHQIGSIKIGADVIRDISDHQLCLWNPVFLEVLEIIIVQFRLNLSFV